MTLSFAPPAIATPQDLDSTLRTQGYAVVRPQQVATLAGLDLAALLAWRPLWDDLPPDNYLRDGGRYRRRRHACFVVDGAAVTLAPHRPHWQPVEYNALHGGMQRHFEPMAAALVGQPAWQQLLAWLGQVSSALKGTHTWYTEAHQFRIDTTDGIGRPTPEGAHRDGVDLVAVFLVGREGVKGGETRVFDATGPNGQRFTLTEPWSLLLLDDPRVIHESTPIQPVADGGYRDTLVVTLRAGNFQGELAR
ncbi:2OG-Fe dioxygenase family protein [Rhodoferax sp.]|uniref:2OG-Fe dioxygenase family protein n=1 Tax=Rhodoferax sp. TaxID=50421 RepID=UPI002ACE7F52|nr:2OG-Fe dioxygenase family protein [Rhodoferax sp.]MDZ7919740.1 2OG-Fe dioxygenase family protein [Rhodoferax sp.]